jgi:phenylpropionate dioxygenase-like ring-hydroxylating dioxygenase large terminal subunit
MTALLDDAAVVRRIFDHIDRRTTDRGVDTWREPVENYLSPERFTAERDLVLRRYPTPFCPSAALPDAGSYVTRTAAGTPILAVRDGERRVRAFRNVCRHRGAQLAEGAGCTKAFSCRYHGWTYGLDGALRHVPHEDGFPGLDKSERGLVPVQAIERDGLVFITQAAPYLRDIELPELPGLLPPGLRLLQSGELEVAANWKILMEGFLEGYHIKATHASTFYPVQYDNLNVVEAFGRNNRVAFPYRAVEKLRNRPTEQWSAAGKLTYVYHLFPNVTVATFPAAVFVTALEPLAIDRTSLVTYVLTDRSDDDGARAAMQRGADLIGDGAAEDRAVACAIQQGLASGANEYFEFGQFEAAIGHFHRTLDSAIAAARGARAGAVVQ